MAILKHIASKNADYGEAERYLIFQHDEYTQKPILDENGHMLIREEYYLDGINCDPFTFAAECQETNAYFHKNQSYNEIKSHHYIISFDPDRHNHLHHTDPCSILKKNFLYCRNYYFHPNSIRFQC